VDGFEPRQTHRVTESAIGMFDTGSSDRTVPTDTRIRRLWRAKSAAEAKPFVVRAFESAGILLAATLVYLALGEFAVRVALHAPIFALYDFRHERAAGAINNLIQFDDLLGWRLKSFIKSGGFNTLDYGFRSNGNADAKVQTGGVLAVGSSFTAGSGVLDDQSWPAHLQQLTGHNVNNAGQGGYQADQIVLLAEQLLPLIRPQVVVVDLIPGTIISTGYASSGWPKPYFTIEHGELVAHNSPVPAGGTASRDGFDIKRFLGHVAVVNSFMAAFFADAWFASEGNTFTTVSTDEIGVTCRLLARLKQKADAADARLLLYLQYSGPEIVDASRTATSGKLLTLVRRAKNKIRPFLLKLPPGAPNWDEASQQVGTCARDLGITTVDELATLRAAYEGNPGDLRKYYQIEPDGSMGHKSSFGNMEVAKLVAAAIGELQPPADQKSK
jgi:hypothetical protein